MGDRDVSSEARPVGEQGLLAQHCELLSMVERVEDLASSGEETRNDSWRADLEDLLLSLVQALEAHFKAERDSLENDFEDAPALRESFAKLDEDHPRILEDFGVAVEAVRTSSSFGDIQLRIGNAISAFREHEAQEAVLFEHSS